MTPAVVPGAQLANFAGLMWQPSPPPSTAAERRRRADWRQEKMRGRPTCRLSASVGSENGTKPGENGCAEDPILAAIQHARRGSSVN